MKTLSRNSALGFFGYLIIFAAVNIIAAHVQSDCGILGVLGLAGCADDIRRAGFPFLVWENGGLIGRMYFSSAALLADVFIALGLSLAAGFVSQRYWDTDKH